MRCPDSQAKAPQIRGEIARDGEGATCLIEVQVSGASDDAAARQIAEVSIGSGQGRGVAWGCDLSYDYVKINAEYTT